MTEVKAVYDNRVVVQHCVKVRVKVVRRGRLNSNKSDSIIRVTPLLKEILLRQRHERDREEVHQSAAHGTCAKLRHVLAWTDSARGRFQVRFFTSHWRVNDDQCSA